MGKKNVPTEAVENIIGKKLKPLFPKDNVFSEANKNLAMDKKRFKS